MTYQYTRFMRDGTVQTRTGTRHPKQIRHGKTAKDKRRN